MKTKDIVRSHNHPETDESFTAIYEAMQSRSPQRNVQDFS